MLAVWTYHTQSDQHVTWCFVKPIRKINAIEIKRFRKTTLESFVFPHSPYLCNMTNPRHVKLPSPCVYIIIYVCVDDIHILLYYYIVGTFCAWFVLRGACILFGYIRIAPKLFYIHILLYMLLYGVSRVQFSSIRVVFELVYRCLRWQSNLKHFNICIFFFF